MVKKQQMLNTDKPNQPDASAPRYKIGRRVVVPSMQTGIKIEVSGRTLSISDIQKMISEQQKKKATG